MNGQIVVDRLDKAIVELQDYYEARLIALEDARKRAIKRFEPERVCGCGWIAGRGDTFANCRDLPQ